MSNDEILARVLSERWEMFTFVLFKSDGELG